MKQPTYFKIVFVLLLLLSLGSFSQTYKPFTIREKMDVKGSMLVIGNAIIGQDNQPFNDLTRDNQDVSMQYIDIDADNSTFSSSSADLVLADHQDGTSTDCYRVAFAGLYWAALLNDGEDRSNITNVKFKIPGGTSYSDISGELIYDAIVNPIIPENNEPGNTPYACFADVTDIVSSLSDIEGTYTMANVVSSEGFNNSTGLSAGWSLIVIYEDPELHTKSFTLFDGFSHIFDGHQETVPVTGFTTPPAGPIDLQFAYGALDGDRTKRATKLEINGKEVTTDDRSANKFFGSVIENLGFGHNPNPPSINNPRVPNSQNTLGYDTGFLEILNSEPEYIKNNDTSADFRLQVARGQADPIFAFFSAFAVDIIAPDIELTKIVLDENGNDIDGDDVVLGQNVFYEITYQNIGNDNITQFTIKDVLPENIIFDPATDIDLSNAGGATLQSYDPTTRTIIFNVPDSSVEINDPMFVIRLAVQVVSNCYELAQACSNEIINQAFGTYQGVLNPTVIEEEGSYAQLECLSEPGPTNFLVDISDCNFEQTEILCGESVTLTALAGYDTYSWSTSPSGSPVIANGQSFSASETGTYYVTNTTNSNCLSVQEIFNVITYGNDITNPVIPYADLLPVCPNDGKVLPYIFLCGANDERVINTGVSDAVSIIWQQLDETSCPEVGVEDCANENDSCTWNQVASGSDYTANTSGQFRLVINYPGGCFNIFYFNVYTNLLEPTVSAEDILCTTPGQITVGGVPSGYEYSLDPNGPWQSSNVFEVNTPGYYLVYIKQIGVDTNPCIFETPEVYIRQRDFTVTSTVIQPVCYDDRGSILLAVNDALPQYYFSIYDGATLVNSVGPIAGSDYRFENLNPGFYTVNATTDDGCTYTEDIEIIQPPLLEVTAALTSPLTCTDGEITIYPTGGTPPYTYFINSDTVSQDTPVYIVNAPGVYDITVYDLNSCSATTSITVDAISAPDFTVSPTNITCTDDATSGAIDINVTNPNGNTLEYSIDNGTTYTASPVFNGLTAGDYEVIVRYALGPDVCTTAPQTVTITAAPQISGTATLTSPLTCTSNGEISVSGVSGGTAPYQYSIDGVNFQAGNTFSGLTDGTYSITIRDTSGCTFITAPITIAPLDPPTDLDFSPAALSCPALTSDVTVTSTGGTSPLEYRIVSPAATAYQASNIFTGLAPGTYTFEVRDANDCSYAESFTIAPLPYLTANTVITKDLDCTASPDGTITTTISEGTAPFNYQVSFNGGAYGSSTAVSGTSFGHNAPSDGTYQFLITDANGCTFETGVQTINAISLPEITSVVQTQPVLCNGDSNAAIEVTINNSVGTPSFTINVFNNTTGMNYGTQTSSLPAGDYTITLTDANACTDTETITITDPTPINVTYSTEPITCGAGGISLGRIIIDGVTGGTPNYTYHVTSVNGYNNQITNQTGGTQVFEVVDFGLYEIIVTDTNGCSFMEQNILVSSPPDNLDIAINATADCVSGGTVEISIGTPLAGSGPYHFAIYTGSGMTYPGPGWQAEDAVGSEKTTFNNLITGATYTFIVYDENTMCYYYETVATPIPTNSTLTVDSVVPNNITCVGSADGNVSFNINGTYGTSTNIDYEVLNSQDLSTTGVSGSGAIPANGTLSVSNLGTLPFGSYIILVTETVSAANEGCSVVTQTPFNITESAIDLNIDATVDQNANCNPTSGVISAVATNGTAPYLYQMTTLATPPLANDPLWASASTFNADAGSYYVHVQDAYGCVRSTPVVVLDSDPVPVISASTNNQCTATEGSFVIDVTLSSAGIAPYSYSVDGGAFQTRTAPFSISNLASGTHTIEVRDANGCGNLVTVDIEAPINLVPDVTAVATCNDDDGEITVTGSGGSGTYNYAISPSTASISFSGNIFSGVPSGTYTITITDAVTLCTAEATVVVQQTPAPTFTTTPTAITCFSDNNGSFEINVSGYSGPYNYEVFDSLGVSITGTVAANTATNPTVVTGMTAGTFSVVITETANPFCSATSSVVINSPSEALTLDVDETSNVTCDDGLGTISAVASGGWGAYEYELTGAATVAYSPNGTFANLSAGSYTVNVRDAGGCVVSENITLDLPTPISATVTASTNLLDCFGDTNAIITVNAIGGQGSNYTYTLNRVSPTVSASGPQTSNVFSGLGAGTYNVTVTDGYNCEFISTDVTIDQPSPIQANLVKETSHTCLTDASLTLSASGGTGSYEYSDTASFTSVLGSFASSVTFPVSDGTHAYYVRDVNGCTANVSNEITIDPLPNLIVNLDISNATINCAGDTTGVIVAVAEGGLGNYVYTLQDTSGNDIDPVTQDSPGIFTNLPVGNYQVRVDSGDCLTISEPVNIDEPSAPLTASFVTTDITCPGTNNGMLEITASGGTGIIKYAISPQMDQFFEEPVFDELAPGDYQVIVQDQLGCYLIYDFTINDAIPVALTIVPNSIVPEVCSGDLNGMFSIEISGGNMPYSVSLDDYEGTYTMGSATQTQFDFTGLEGGDHIVYVRDALGCETEWNITFPESVAINPLVEVTFDCVNNISTNMVMVTTDDSVDPADLDYSLNSGPYQSSNIFIDVPAGIGNYIDVRHTNGCIQRTAPFDVEQYEQLQLAIGDGVINQIVAMATGGAEPYEFTLNGESFGSENEFAIYESGNYTVTVTDAYGCTATASGYFEYVDVCIPNYFVPENGGWGPGCTSQYRNLTFDIFDRYGRKIATLKVDEKWDGKYNGKELPTGDYWYVVKLNDPKDDRDFVGHFTLYR
ncbi:T9SS type B sorting domain-containing protein [Flavisericum labens]|uniref:T9SS type B sorting domain-containing protein n=1 Tax=Flavisericum labens TaxID=3377112 RepID=UPI00387B6F06